MLRFCFLVLSILVITGQVLAQASDAQTDVEVYVDVVQTGPTDSSFNVKLQFGTAEQGTYRISGGYNGTPILHSEETIIKTSWTYKITPNNDVNCSPQEGTSAIAIITASSSKVGIHTVTITMKVEFTIEKNVPGGQTTTRTETYSKDGSIIVNITSGKLKVIIDPSDDFRGRSYTNFGISESGGIKIEYVDAQHLEPQDPSVESSDRNICRINGTMNFQMRGKSGTLTLRAKAKDPNDNKKELEEVVAVQVVSPNAITISKNYNASLPNNEVGAGFNAKYFLLPRNVSFASAYLKEIETASPIQMGIINRNRKSYSFFAQRVGRGIFHVGCKWLETTDSVTDSLGIKSGSIYWNNKIKCIDIMDYVTALTIPVNLNTSATIQRKVEFGDWGSCTITRTGGNNKSASATRVPKDENDYKNKMERYEGGFKYQDLINQ
jgi:hypothetical protein